ncbi:MAG: complex I NDUFA9 subunit family protein [Piscinibacter sp.]|uniref:complex I NDUFA9 subunit family protein n=1 Tax=Piscinibacter defluvii TaxID=1796922 RepID=UPI000FDF5DDE|nr:complex I NDUFA9 subunit family protein [Piscinibacter sp.]MCW5667627.1 complex I NDUFA9 subunit family protein [Piscinibacter sp.]
MSNIVVTGGTGFVGRSVCAKLVERSGGASGRIVVPTRRIAHARHIQMLPTVQPVETDLSDPAALARLLQGADALVHLVAVLHGSEERFRQVHVELPQRLAAACAQAGVRRVVHVSALGVAADAPSRYLRSKSAGETVWRSSGLDVTVLRPSVIFGAHDRLLNLFAQLQALAPLLPLAGADSRYQPVWVEDVAAAVLRCLDDPTTIGQVIECAGPDTYTLRQIVEAAGRWAGHPRPVFPLPEALARLQAMLMELLPGEPLMSRDNIDSMRVPNIASGTLPGLDRLGIRPAALDAVVPQYLAPGQGPARLDPWRARARRT